MKTILIAFLAMMLSLNAMKDSYTDSYSQTPLRQLVVGIRDAQKSLLPRAHGLITMSTPEMIQIENILNEGLEEELQEPLLVYAGKRISQTQNSNYKKKKLKKLFDKLYNEIVFSDTILPLWTSDKKVFLCSYQLKQHSSLCTMLSNFEDSHELLPVCQDYTCLNLLRGVCDDITGDYKENINNNFNSLVSIFDLHRMRIAADFLDAHELLEHVEDRLFKQASFDGIKMLQQAHDDKKMQPITLQHDAGVRTVAMSSDGTALASGFWDNSVKLWNVEMLNAPKILTDQNTSCLLFSPNGNVIALGSNGEITLYTLSTGNSMSLTGHSSWIKSLAFNHDATCLASGSSDSTIKLWNTATGDCITTLTGHKNMINAIIVSPDDKYLISGSFDGTVKKWDIAQRRCIETIVFDISNGISTALSNNGKLFALGLYDNSLKIYDITTAQLVRKLEGHTGPISSLVFSHDGTYLVSGSWDKTIRIWDIATGECKKILTDHKDRVNAVALNPDGDLLVSASKDKTVKLYTLYNKKEIKRLILTLIEYAYKAYKKGRPVSITNHEEYSALEKVYNSCKPEFRTFFSQYLRFK